MTGTAYSYIRFSTPEQAAGDSLRRQTEDATAWCARHGVRLDESTTLRDLGKSAFTGAHRKNPDRHALAAFLKLVERGKVPRGSYLIIENLDRLSREDERAALRLWMDILDAGVNIVQLNPETVFRHEKSDMFDIMRAVMELSRGHSESARKSERNGKSWRNKVKMARESGGTRQPPRRLDERVSEAITDRLPAWVELRAGRKVLIPERAAAVRRIFELAAQGYGLTATAQRLEAEGVPAFGGRVMVADDDGKPVVHERGRDAGKPKYRAAGGGRFGSGFWTRCYVSNILKDRRAMGEYQPRGTDRKPDGPPIRGYFPAVVTEAEFDAARAGSLERKKRPGRLSKHVNVFAGLLRDARDGQSYFLASYGSGGRGRVLVNKAGVEGKATYRSFPAEAFERAILSCLREIDPREILNGDAAPDGSLLLAGELAAVEASITALVADLEAHGDSPALFQRLRQKEARQAELVPLLAAAREKAAHPLSEAWGETQTLIEALDSAPDPDEARLRLRSALRRIIDSVWLLVMPQGRARLCAVQIWFADGQRHRDYLIAHWQAVVNKWARQPASTEVLSSADVQALGPLDLRKPADARRLERALLALDLAGLDRNGG
jgi:DNA invertase Pin-like site-specific DNA recombinase